MDKETLVAYNSKEDEKLELIVDKSSQTYITFYF